MSSHRYRLRPTNTFAAVIVRNDDGKLLSRLGHDHVVRATEFTSTVAIDIDHPDQLRFSLTFPATALVVDAPEDRRRVDMDPEVSDRDRRQTHDNMLGKGQLHARRFKNLKFRVDGARTADDQTWILDASLTVRHERHHFEFPVDISVDPHLRVSGKVELTHGDLGLTPYRAPMGTLRNREELTFLVDIDAAPL